MYMCLTSWMGRGSEREKIVDSALKAFFVTYILIVGLLHFKMFGNFNHRRTGVSHEKKHFVVFNTLWPQQ